MKDFRKCFLTTNTLGPCLEVRIEDSGYLKRVCKKISTNRLKPF